MNISAQPLNRKRIAIVGYAFRFPGPPGDGFWSALCDGRDLVGIMDPTRWSQDIFLHPRETEPGTSYSRFAGSLGDIAGFDAAFFGISPREAAQMDPQQRLLLELTWESLEAGGIPPSKLRGSRSAVFVGFSGSEYSYRVAEDLSAINAFSMTGITGSIAANRISYAFDLRGPSMAVDTACSSSLVAFHQACQSIHSGDADMAITGAVSLHTHPLAHIGFSKASMLSRRGRCQVFDASGDGYVRSEGGAMVVLKPLDAAVADGNRIYAVVAGSGLNCDGKTNGITVPSAEAQAALLRDVYARAGIDPSNIDYLEAHGTGTAVGDPIEARALGEALGKRRAPGAPLLVGSVKSNLGHLEPASGMAGMVKALLCLEHRSIPRSIHFETPNPQIPLDELNLKVVTEQTALDPVKPLIIGVNSFGFGGANAHIILQSYNQPPDGAAGSHSAHELGEAPLLVSGRSEAALKAAALRLAEFIRAREDVPLYDIAYSCAFHHDWHSHRAVTIGHDRHSAALALERFANSKESRSVASGRALARQAGPVFVYSGNGSQWAGMGGKLLAESREFRNTIGEVDQWMRHFSGVSVLEVLAGGESAPRLDATEVAQPALFALQVGITRMFESWGIRPSAVVGHSVGEIAAAWACGALSLEQAAYLVCERSAWQGATRGKGAMTAVGMGAVELEGLLEASGNRAAIGAINSANSVTVSGSREDLTSMEALLEARGTAYHRLALDYAFHSEFMDGIKDGVESALQKIRPGRARIPFFSTVTGELMAGDALDAVYWWRNIRDPVRFGPAIEAILQAGESIFVEIGPHPVLHGYLGECLRTTAIEGRVIPTMSRQSDGAQSMRMRAFDAIIAGCRSDLGALFPEKGRLVNLPFYPWQRERHWLSSSGEESGGVARHPVHPLLGYRLDQNETHWESRLDLHRASAYADHCVGGEVILPATAYVEMAFAAAHAINPEAHSEIVDLEIRSPLPLGTNHSQVVRFMLDPVHGNFTVKSKERLSNDAWRVHATGRLTASHTGSQAGAAPRFTFSRPDKTVSAEVHYRMAQEVGLEYGPAFRAVGEAWSIADPASTDVMAVVGATLTTPAELAEDAPAALIHPSFVDGAFQLLLHFQGEHTANAAAFVPVRIGRATLLHPHVEVRFAKAVLHRGSARSLVADFTLYGADREPVAILREVRFRAVQLSSPTLSGLSSVYSRAIPSPLPSTTQRAALPATDTLIVAGAARLHASLRQQQRWQYFNDVEPLLEALLSAFAAAALKQLEGQPQTGQNPLLLVRLEHLAGKQAMIDPGPLWSQMWRDYPDHTSEILWIGRLGMHLADIVTGSISPEHFLPKPDGTDDDAWAAPWMPGSADYARAIADMIDVALASLPHGRRLRVLAINAEKFPAVVNVLAGMEPDRVDLVIAGADVGGLAEHDAIVPFDLILVEDGLASVPNREAALADLRRRIAVDGVLVLLERHPSRAALLAMEFLASDSEIRPRVRPLTPDVWHLELARQGFRQSMVIEDVPGIKESSYVLIARAVPLKGPSGSAGLHRTALAAAAVPRRWLVVSDKSGLSARIADTVCTELRERHQLVTTVQADPVSCDSWAELLDFANPLSKAAGLTEIQSIILLSGLADANQTIEKMFRREAGRCDSLVGLLAACAERKTRMDCWAITAGAASSLLPEAVRTELGITQNADDASFWGFVRSAINERPNLALRLVDLSVPKSPNAPMALVDLLLQPDAEDEVILTPAGRFVVRMDSRPFGSMSAPDPQGSCLQLGRPASGQLRNLHWEHRAARDPREDEVVIEVRATGLNFRDVMCAMGQLTEEALEGGFAGDTLGMEIAGVVTGLGSRVKEIAVGDEVIAFTSAGFATRAVTRASAVLKKPAAWTFEAAATIQSAFFTAYYGLHHLARLAPGEKVLIHGAAGGVGLAAIQIAQMKGAEIFATAGSESKRDLLRLLDVDHVLDSRSLAFGDQILALTGGRGVDVVLNSLAGEAMMRSLEILQPLGRFLELGKRDFYENTPVGLRPLRNNVSYFGVDVDQLMLDRPELTRALMQELMQLFDFGTLHPLPYRAFKAQDVVGAFRFMQQSRHVGKIVLSFDSPPTASAGAASPRVMPAPLALPADATYLVTGGLRGFGLRTAQWLAAKGARHLILIGRSATPATEAQDAIASLVAQGVQVRAVRCDVGDLAALQALFDDMRDTMPPLRGVIHASTVYQDGLVRNLDRDAIEAVLAPKVLGAAYLHRLTRQMKLDFFVLYSSAATVFGNPGQANYVAANRYLESLADARRSRGLPAICVAWGLIDDVGLLARNREVRERVQNRFGEASFYTSQEALDALEYMMVEDLSGIAVLKAERASLSRFLPPESSPKYQPLVTHASAPAHDAKSTADLRRWAQETSEAEVAAGVTAMLKQEIADILCMDADKLDLATTLQDLGLDSLMGVELMTAVDVRFGVNIPVLALAEASTVDRLARRIVKELKRGDGIAKEDPESEIAEQIRSVAAVHASEMDEEQVEAIIAEAQANSK